MNVWISDASSMPAADRHAGGRGLALWLVALLVAASATACLPEGTRGDGIGATGSVAPGQPPIIASAAPTGPTPRPTFVPPTPTPAPTFMVHVVAKGDSLGTIAHRFGTTARSIAFWNRSTYPSLDPQSPTYRPDLLRLGWTLFLIPNDVVDEQDLPDPSSSAVDAAPSDSAIPG